MSELRFAPIIGDITSVSDVQTRLLPPNDPNSQKGRNTWNWLSPGADRVVVFRRNKEGGAGNHFHSREHKSKDPEKFLLIEGEVTFWFKDLAGRNREVDLKAEETGPVEILIPPYLLHGLVVKSEAVLFLEWQAGTFDPSFNYSVEEFDLLAEWLEHGND
jgi:hypothetical protein